MKLRPRRRERHLGAVEGGALARPKLGHRRRDRPAVDGWPWRREARPGSAARAGPSVRLVIRPVTVSSSLPLASVWRSPALDLERVDAIRRRGRELGHSEPIDRRDRRKHQGAAKIGDDRPHPRRVAPRPERRLVGEGVEIRLLSAAPGRASPRRRRGRAPARAAAAAGGARPAARRRRRAACHSADGSAARRRLEPAMLAGGAADLPSGRADRAVRNDVAGVAGGTGQDHRLREAPAGAR